MGDFTADWLALREAADAQARSLRLARLVAERFSSESELRAIDLASGTGANVRYLSEHLPPRQDWLLVDHDPDLLTEVPAEMRAWAVRHGHEIVAAANGFFVTGEQLVCRLATRVMDLGGVGAASHAEGSIFGNYALVTASALLDLVSERWLQALAGRCRDARAAALFALTYDGRIQCSPEEGADDLVCDLVNAHQRTDKGFGPALGPEAPAVAERVFADAGYHVEREKSDWVLPPEARGLQQRLIEGWAGAAIEMAPEQAKVIGRWSSRRLAHVRENRSHLIVGHEDLAAWPRRV